MQRSSHYALAGASIVAIALAATLSSEPAEAFNPVSVHIHDCNADPKLCDRRVGYSTDPNERGVKFVSPSCPMGTRILSGGYRILSTEGSDPNPLQVAWSFPEAFLNRWAVHVRNIRPVSGIAPMVRVEVSAVCLKTEFRPVPLLDEHFVKIVPHAYHAQGVVSTRFTVYKQNSVNDPQIDRFRAFADQYCRRLGYKGPRPDVFYSPEIGLHGFTTDDRRIVATVVWDSGQSPRSDGGGLESPTGDLTINTTHVRCNPR